MTDTAAPLVEIRDLHFSYGANRIFRGLNLSIPRGKIDNHYGGWSRYLV